MGTPLPPTAFPALRLGAGFLFLMSVMSMAELSPQAASSAPDFAGTLRKRLEEHPHKVIAAEAGIDASHVGKVLNGTAALKLDDVAKLVRLAGLKAVDASRTCVRTEEIAFLRRLYRVVSDHAPWLLNQGDE